ncbi:hypothetical protein Ae201684P_010284 [Aphanomyces euteiches]|uniref:STI1/HOP DP domain-containing protein n=1 Tax=Aphanomyces euteiches TaxID=100861 RepID=A0A6G0WBS6_9STRA|nr:hypothetical protein Ae201684_016912 [Aphanomyces euteiches]KAH9076338.1 hypothetical protein Ae201684P_010284 [Aphanomyces euteiches]KAH9137136.1 hypothetical protein AeRB84_017982 [Aphanomyces euteiches]KAH9151515.1 hypothetical protein AeRB84_005881 [Aphanomyces euteiches]
MYVDEEDYERASYRSRTKREASGEMQAQLCHAAAVGDLPLVRRMLTVGVDADVVDDEKSTPLLLACFRRHDEIIQELLEYGPNVNFANKFGFTPLYHAAADGNYPLASTLLALGAAVGTADKFGWTPVMIAARNGHADVVQLLLDSNASPSRRNQMGKTARDLAFSKGHDCVVAVLDACLESYRAMGISALEAFDFQAAVDSFSELIHAVNPPLPFDLFQRCQAWDGLGCASLALDDAKAYLESQGEKTADGLAKVGHLLYRQSHHSEAMQAYQSGLALDPQHADCQAGLAQVELTKTVQCAFSSDVFIHLRGHALFQLFLEIDPELSRRMHRVVFDPKAFDALDKHFQILLLVLQHKRAADLRVTETTTSTTTLPMRETLPGMSTIVRAFQNDDELFMKLASNASTVGLLGDDSVLAMIRHVQDDPKTLWTEYRMDSSMAAIVHVLFQDEPSEDDAFVLVDGQDADCPLS